MHPKVFLYNTALSAQLPCLAGLSLFVKINKIGLPIRARNKIRKGTGAGTQIKEFIRPLNWNTDQGWDEVWFHLDNFYSLKNEF